MKYNLTYEEYEKQKENSHKPIGIMFSLAIVFFVSIGAMIGFSAEGKIIGLIGGGLLGLLSVLVFGGIAVGLIMANEPPFPPFCIYEYFEEKKEKVISIKNVGKKDYIGIHPVYKASNQFIVETNKERYITEIKENKVFSSKKHPL